MKSYLRYDWGHTILSTHQVRFSLAVHEVANYYMYFDWLGISFIFEGDLDVVKMKLLAKGKKERKWSCYVKLPCKKLKTSSDPPTVNCNDELSKQLSVTVMIQHELADKKFDSYNDILGYEHIKYQNKSESNYFIRCIECNIYYRLNRQWGTMTRMCRIDEDLELCTFRSWWETAERHIRDTMSTTKCKVDSITTNWWTKTRMPLVGASHSLSIDPCKTSEK